VQGPFQIATGLFGQENVFSSLVHDAGFITSLMEFAFQFHTSWAEGWEKLHGTGYGMFNIGDDDIDTAFILSPKKYREIVLPIHVRYGNRFKSIHWHSCGDTNAIMEDISHIPGVQLLEIGPKDDALRAADIFQGTEVRFYKCPDPVSELDEPQPKAQENMIENVLGAGELVPIKVLCEADNLEKGLVLLKTFRDIAGEN
jgi:hypothetical protein